MLFLRETNERGDKTASSDVRAKSCARSFLLSNFTALVAMTSQARWHHSCFVLCIAALQCSLIGCDRFCFESLTSFLFCVPRVDLLLTALVFYSSKQTKRTQEEGFVRATQPQQQRLLLLRVCLSSAYLLLSFIDRWSVLLWWLWLFARECGRICDSL